VIGKKPLQGQKSTGSAKLKRGNCGTGRKRNRRIGKWKRKQNVREKLYKYYAAAYDK
jgi:hypothetical protein